MRKGRDLPFKGSCSQRLFSVSMLLAVMLSACLFDCPTARTSNPSGWTLVWSDEFDGPSGSAVNASKWSFDVGGIGCGNNELETYTDRAANFHVNDGRL